MADNVQLSAPVGTGSVVRAVNKGGVDSQVVILDAGGGGTESLLTAGQALMAGSLPVVIASNQSAVPVSGTFWQTTQPVSAASLPLPTGAATSALQGTGNTSLGSIDTKTPSLGQALAAASVPVVLTAAQLSTLTPLSTVAATQSGTWTVAIASAQTIAVTNAGTFAVQSAQSGSWTVTANAGTGTFAVSAATLPLPTGASTAAKQPALGTAGSASGDVITVQGVTSMTPLLATVTFASAQAVTQSGAWNITNISGTVSLPTGAATSANQTNASQKTQIVDGSGNVIGATSNALNVNITGGGGSGGTSSNFSSAFPSTGTAAGASDGTDMKPLLVDGSGFLKVNVSAGSSGNAAASATGSAVPTDADYQGVNVGGTLRGQTGVNPTGTVYAAQTDLTSVGGTSFALGQQLAAGSIPVVLTAAQITTLTPPTSVTANAGTNLNTSALALETGGNLATLAGIVTTGKASVFFASAQAVTQSGTWNITNVSGTVSLPTGASTAAKQPALGTAGSASADVITIQGIASMTKLLVTPDANSSVNLAQVAGSSTATGHGTASGALRVELPTDGTGVIATVGAVTAISNALPAGTNLLGKVGIDQTTIGTTNATTPVPCATGGPGVKRVESASSLTGTSAQNVKNAAGQVYGWYLYNNASAIRVIHLFNSASTPTAGSGTPVWNIVLPANGGANVEFSMGIPFSTGIGYTITTGIADTDTGAPTLYDVEGVLLYK